MFNLLKNTINKTTNNEYQNKINLNVFIKTNQKENLNKEVNINLEILKAKRIKTNNSISKKIPYSDYFNILKDDNNIFFNIEEKRKYYNQKMLKYSPKISINSKKWKSREQVLILEKELEKSPIWNKRKIREISYKTCLSESAVYKWKWDNSFMI